MGVYFGPLSGPTGVVTRPTCFTRATAASMRSALAALDGFLGVVVGAGLGLVASLLFGPEVVSKLVGFLVGAIAGGLIGVAAALAIIRAGACTTCPPGVDAFCVCFLFIIVAPSPPIPLPPFFVPCPGSCATVIPAGCP